MRDLDAAERAFIAMAVVGLVGLVASFIALQLL